MIEGVWVLGEERNGTVHPVSYELLAWGRGLAEKLGARLTCVILGQSSLSDAKELVYRGADRVVLVSHERLSTFRVDSHTRVLTELIERYKPEVLLAAATTMGRTVMPALAATLHTGLTADCTELDIDEEKGLLLQTRPAIGGNVLATITTPRHRPQMATVRPKSKRPLPRDPSRQGDLIQETFEQEDFTSRVVRVAFELDETSEGSIQDADIVVAGGRGFKNAKGFADVSEVARRLGAAVGASRAVVDQGWASYAHQIGLSGKSVTPKLYMALGISGSPNHLAGMASSEVIVAVNKDPEANIFKVADFGIVGDLADVIPVLLERLDHLNAVAPKESLPE